MFDQFSNKYDLILQTTMTNNATVTGVLDTLGYGANSLTVVAIIGAVTASANMTAIKLQQSDTDSDYVDIVGATFNAATTTAASAHKIMLQPLDLRGKKRYIRFTATVANATPGAQLTVVGVMGDCGVAPTKNLAVSYGATDVIFAGSVV